MNNNEIKATILIVDDSIVNIDLMAAILEPKYRIKIATKGQKTLDIANSKTPPDLILLDIMMPDMNGYEVCKVLKSSKKTRDIPVVFVTSKNEEADEEYGFSIGAVDYITKPVSPSIVHARVSSQLAIANQKHHLEELVAKRTKRLSQTRLELINTLGRASEYKDTDTGLHVIRMGRYSEVIAQHLGLPSKESEIILHAAPMHDIGKIGIPDNILQKTGKLEQDEWDIITQHPEIGMKILGDDKSDLMKAARRIAISHHEKWNGRGYPYALKEEEIPLCGRIVAVADVFDALTMKRPYKEAWCIDDALDLIRSESGEHFDPAVIEAFFKAVKEIIEIKEYYKNTPS